MGRCWRCSKPISVRRNCQTFYIISIHPQYGYFMSTKLKNRVRKMNFQRQGNERKFETLVEDDTNYYDKLYLDKTKNFLRKMKNIAWHFIFLRYNIYSLYFYGEKIWKPSWFAESHILTWLLQVSGDSVKKTGLTLTIS